MKTGGNNDIAWEKTSKDVDGKRKTNVVRKKWSKVGVLMSEIGGGVEWRE